MKIFRTKKNKRPAPYVPQKRDRSGFTIIETMVSVSLFIIITTIGIGALLNANLIYNKSQDMRAIIDNLNFVMEEMSRNIRTGYNYHCLDVSVQSVPAGSNSLSVPEDCLEGAGGWTIAFESAYGAVENFNDQWVYSISGGKILKSEDSGVNFTQLTSEEVIVDSDLSGFVVTGAEPSPGSEQQPLVTIRLVGTITYQNVVSPFSIQTTVSQRILNI